MPSELLLTAARTLEIADDVALLGALAQTVAHEAELSSNIIGVNSAESLLEKLAANVKDQEIANAFSDLGLNDAYNTLVKSLTVIVDQSGKVSKIVAPLLAKLSTFAAGSADGLLTWNLATGDQAIPIDTGYNLDLGAAATITLNASAPDWEDPSLPPLLALSADGQAKAGASGELRLPYGTLDVGGDAAAHLTLTYFFEANRTEIFAAAAAEALAHLADPFDFDAVWGALKDTSLKGVTFAYGGTAAGQLQVALGDVLALGRGVTATVGLTASVTASYSSTFNLVLQRTGAGNDFAMKVHLSRAPTTTAGGNGKLGLTVDYSSLTAPVLSALNTAIGAWDQALDSIKPFLSPGTWLRDRAATFLSTQIDGLASDPGLQAALKADMDALLGLQPATTEAVSDWLRKQLIDAFERGAVLTDGNLVASIDRTIDALKQVAPNLVQAAQTELEGIYRPALTQLEADFVLAVQQAWGDPSALVAGLNAAGAEVNRVLGSFDDALAAVRELLDNVDQKLHAALDKTKQAIEKRITANLYVEDSKTTGSIVEVDGVFTAATGDSRDIYKALVIGKLQVINDLLDGRQPSGFNLTRDTSSITRFSKRSSERGLEIAFLNFALQGKDLITADATVEVDGLGNVHVNTSAGLAETIGTPSTTRQVSFADSHAIAFASAMPAKQALGPPSLELGVGALFTDKSLKWTDIESFIDGLGGRAKLLSADAPTKAKAAFDAWSGAPGGGGRISGSIAASLKLTGQQIETLLYVGTRTGGALPRPAKQAIVAAGLDILTEVGAIDASQFARGCGAALAQLRLPAMTQVDLVLGYRDGAGDDDLPGADTRPLSNNVNTDNLTDDAIDDYLYFLDTAFPLGKLVELIDVMGALYATAPQPTDDWVGRYQSSQTRLAVDSSAWLEVLGPLSNLFSARLTPWTIAFMAVLVKLSNAAGPNGGGVQLTLTHTPSSDAPQTVAFI